MTTEILNREFALEVPCKDNVISMGAKSYIFEMWKQKIVASSLYGNCLKTSNGEPPAIQNQKLSFIHCNNCHAITSFNSSNAFVFK